MASSSSVRASGFSTKTALPARRPSHTKRAWLEWRVTTKTASIAGSSSTSRGSVVARSKPNLRWALTQESDDDVATAAIATSVRLTRWGRSMVAG